MAVARETLERALQLSYQLNMELNSTSEWLNNLVTEIHIGEGPFTDQPNPIEELRIYKVIFLEHDSVVTIKRIFLKCIKSLCL